MVEIVYSDRVASEPIQTLVKFFEDSAYAGTLYVGCPISNDVKGVVRVDALYVAKDAGVIVLDVSHLNVPQLRCAITVTVHLIRASRVSVGLRFGPHLPSRRTRFVG